MKRLIVLLSVMCIVTSFLGCSNRVTSENTVLQSNVENGKELNTQQSQKTTKSANAMTVNNLQNEELKKRVYDLITKSLDIQYGISNAELTEVFSNKFVKRIQETSNFYKKELKSYKIISINHDETKDISTENLVVYVRMEDTKGGYTQVIHLVKKNGIFVIDEIEYDM